MKPIESAREGTDVFDFTGTRIGKVATIKMGDPRAVAAQGQQPKQSGGLIGALLSVVDGTSGVPEERKNRRYESAEAVDRVTGKDVFLKAPATAEWT